ncbi:MAG: ABC transporter permease [Chloroflexota bacterium]|nr:ABC transporter permease [Chloroflexota bacterium]
MHKYIIRRLLLTVVVVLGVTLLTFLSIHMAGDPTFFYVSERASAEERQAARERLGFDRPLHVQYFDFLFNLARGDTGNSLAHRVPAFDVVMERMPATLELTIGGFLLSTTAAFPIGVLAATRRGTMTDGTLMLGAMLGQSMPSFWLGLMFILFFAVTLRWMPVSGHVPFIKPLLEGDAALALSNLPNAIRYLLMPTVAVSVYSISRNSRLIRSAVLEVLRQDYVVTARAKGLNERTVMTRHAIRNALIPIVTVLALQFAFLLNGVIVVETVFSWPGVGRLVFDAVSQRDVPLVLTAVVLLSFLFVSANLIADLMYGFLDPRIRLE